MLIGISRSWSQNKDAKNFSFKLNFQHKYISIHIIYVYIYFHSYMRLSSAAKKLNYILLQPEQHQHDSPARRRRAQEEKLGSSQFSTYLKKRMTSSLYYHHPKSNVFFDVIPRKLIWISIHMMCCTECVSTNSRIYTLFNRALLINMYPAIYVYHSYWLHVFIYNSFNIMSCVLNSIQILFKYLIYLYLWYVLWAKIIYTNKILHFIHTSNNHN